MYAQRKDIVRYCKEHLAKRSMYPSHAELEKAAKKLAKGEDEKSASFRRAVKKVVGGNQLLPVIESFIAVSTCMAGLSS